MLSKNSLHSNLLKLRALSTGQGLRPFSTAAAAAPEPKVLMENHSQALSEFKLNVPKTLNSLDMDMVHTMLEKVKQWHFNPEQAPRVLLISGVGGKAFCAGGDIKMVYDSGMGKLDPSIKATFFHDEYVLDYSLTQMKPLQISIWNGIVMGGGVGVSVHAPIRVATDNTVYAMPETGIGFFTDVGGAYFLSRIKHNIQHGLYLGLTGQRIKARELVQWGIATHFVPQTHIEGLYKDLKEKVKRESSDKEIQDIVNSHSDLTVDQTPIPDEKEIEWLFQNDSILDIVTRIENDATPFGEKVRKQIASLSPLSLAVVFEQIKRGKTMGLKEVFEMEYKISQGFTNHTEFFEGVRALLIDKDRNPQWKYKHVRDVTQKDLDHFFNRDNVLDLTLKQ